MFAYFDIHSMDRSPAQVSGWSCLRYRKDSVCGCATVLSIGEYGMMFFQALLAIKKCDAVETALNDIVVNLDKNSLIAEPPLSLEPTHQLTIKIINDLTTQSSTQYEHDMFWTVFNKISLHINGLYVTDYLPPEHMENTDASHIS